MESNKDSFGKISSSSLYYPHHHHHHRPHPHPHPRHHHHHHNHHHFFYISPHCPLHRSILQPHNHSPMCSFSTYSQTLPPIAHSETFASVPSESQLSFSGGFQPNEAFGEVPTTQDEVEQLEVEEEEEPIFVMTDEWRDFFAKSDAKRLAKKQAKKKGGSRETKN